jgi:hypothetical protein
VKIENVYVGWQSSATRVWHTVGKLSFSDERDMYQFQYTNGLRDCESEFPYFSGMDNPNITYYSKELFAFAKNRLLSKKRPEYKEFMSWLDSSSESLSALEELAFSGGVKGTDALEFFSLPHKTSNEFKISFFVRGIRHLSELSVERIKEIALSDKIYLMTDPQNIGDHNAVAIRVDNPALLIGYCPKYLSKSVRELLSNQKNCETLKTKILRVNKSAPLQYRIALELTASWPEGIDFLGDEQCVKYNN